SAESANAALGTLNRELVNVGQGVANPEFLRTLNILGVGPRDRSGRVKTASELLLDIANSSDFKALSPRDRAGTLARLGMDEHMISLLSQGVTKIQELLEEGKKLAPIT